MRAGVSHFSLRKKRSRSFILAFNLAVGSHARLSHKGGFLVATHTGFGLPPAITCETITKLGDFPAQGGCHDHRHPSLAKFAVLWNPANTAEGVAVKATETAARSLGMSVAVEHFGNPSEFVRVFSAIARSGAKALVVLPDPMFLANREQLVELTNRSQLPAIYMETGFVAVGGLISYGPNFTELFRRAAVYVDKILKGAKPGDSDRR
jgi:hypothetical protein